MPTQNMKKRLVHALETLGVEIAGRHADHLRWSVTDLATDLAPLLSAGQEPARGEAPTQKAPHPFSVTTCADCDEVRLCAQVVIAWGGEAYWLCAHCLEDLAIQLYAEGEDL